MAIKTVGVIGLGAMGRPMSRHMIKAGFTVLGYDPDQNARTRASEVGVRLLASPKEIARDSDFVIIIVGFDKQVETVVFGDDGILAGAHQGLIIGLGSTASPSYARDLADRLQGRGIGLLDMPLTRSAEAAESGTMLVMGGGEQEIFETCRPVLKTFATDIFNLGPFGSGQVGKMVNNMILWACMVANDEALEFGEKLGVDQESMRAALVLSSAANFSLIERADTRPTPWAEKDMIIAQREADKLRFSIPMGGLVKEMIKSFKVKRGYPTPGL